MPFSPSLVRFGAGVLFHHAVPSATTDISTVILDPATDTTSVLVTGSDANWLAKGWQNLGYTDGGITVREAATTTDQNVDQELSPIASPVTGTDVRITSSLSEFTLKNMAFASGWGIHRVGLAPTTTTAGWEELEFRGGTVVMSESMMGVEAPLQGGEPWRTYMFRTNPVATVEVGLTKDAKSNIPLEMRGGPTPILYNASTVSRQVLMHQITPATG